jgi:hypothetical protein
MCSLLSIRPSHTVYGHTFLLQADANYWAVLDQLSSFWTPSSQLLSQDTFSSSSHSAPLPSCFPPLASYAAAVAGLRFSPSVLVPSYALVQRTFSALPCGSDGSLVDGSPACPFLSLASSSILVPPLPSPVVSVSPVVSSS